MALPKPPKLLDVRGLDAALKPLADRTWEWVSAAQDLLVALREEVPALNTAISNASGAVSSVFGRTGSVVAVLGDYAASLITNDSSVVGATIKDALNTLLASAGVTSVFGRTGTVTAQTGDYTATQVTGAVADTRQVLAGAGLTGGGNLTADRTLALATGYLKPDVPRVISTAVTLLAEEQEAIAGGSLTLATGGSLTLSDDACVDVRGAAPDPTPLNTRWAYPVPANPDDDEFLGPTLSSAWALYDSTATLTSIGDAVINPYINSTASHHVDSGTYRKSWLTMQTKGDSVSYFLCKRRPMPQNGFVWTRISMGTHHIGLDNRIALSLFAEASSKPDCAVASGNQVTIMMRSNVDDFQVAVFKLVAGVETDVITAFTGGTAFSGAPEYLGIQKIGTSYYFWLYWGDGMRELCGTTTHPSVMYYVGLTCRTAAEATVPSNAFQQFDFVRFVDNTTVFQP